MKSFIEYLRWLAVFKFGLVFYLVVGFLAMTVNIAHPYLSRYLTNEVILNTALDNSTRITILLQLGGGMMLLLLISAVLDLFRSIRCEMISRKLGLILRERLFDHLLRLPLPRLNDLKVGGITSRLSNDVLAVSELINHTIMVPIIRGLQIVLTIFVIFIVNWKLALIALVVLPMMLGISSVITRTLRPIYSGIHDIRSAIASRVTEVFSGIRIVRGYCREETEKGEYLRQNQKELSLNVRAKSRELTLQSSWNLLILMSSFGIICVGGYMFVKGWASMGDVIAMALYMALILNPVVMVVQSFNQAQQGLAALDRILEVLEIPCDKPDLPDAILSPSQITSIDFRNVSYAYSMDRMVLKNLNFTVNAGQTVAIVGRSGAGKSTLTDLIARFNDPVEGKILVDGIPLPTYRISSYREIIGFVEQDVTLFDTSVKENIAYGKKGATDQEIIQAARQANAHDFIEAMSEGYDTIVGERGVKLSGGQRQRLSIARAFLANPQILILDEATSNLDTESEQLVQESLELLTQNRTTFIIAHRLSTIAKADEIFVLQEGEIVERGSHEELLFVKGHYSAMIHRQQALLEPTAV